MILKKEKTETNIKKKTKIFYSKKRHFNYMELILKIFSTTEIESFLAKKTTRSSF